ncbi:hypothetical protein AB6A40_001667 [Gnathostoma spinigerum]|uniref:Uncharacterized protein n=1 Tax=Gnathostoma spinigerum TaxID=75299 RepID=A0ABD6E4U8_9BILA
MSGSDGEVQREQNGQSPSDQPQSSARNVELSERSQLLVDSSKELLGRLPSASRFSSNMTPAARKAEARYAGVTTSEDDDYSTTATTTTTASPRYPLHMPVFKKIDFDDVVIDPKSEDRIPAWKQWQDSIKDSYYKVRKAAERSKEEADFMNSELNEHRRARRSESPFDVLVHSRPNTLPLYHTTNMGETVIIDAPNPGLYAAPAVTKSQGVESSYERRASDIEARLLKTSCLPDSMKTITKKEFRNGPAPAVGSLSEAMLDEADYDNFLPRPYYSRPNRDDPDYFDFDLQHSVDLFKRPEGKYVPRGPQNWEEKLLGEAKGKGEAPLSGYIFTKGDPDWRTKGSSYLSAALRTPSFWERRFESIGKQVRDSNPVSLDSINRNKPVPSRWTEYRDPDLEDPYDSDSGD